VTKVNPQYVMAFRRLTDLPVSVCRDALTEAGGDLAAVRRRRRFAMGPGVLRWGAVVAALLALLSLTGSGRLRAADVEADSAATTEAVVGTDRVAVLSVTRFTEFVPGAAGKGPRAVTSLRVLCLREWLGQREPGTVLTACGVEVFAAGTTDKPVRFVRSSRSTTLSTRNYGGYADWLKRQSDEWSAAKLPAVTDANLASVYGVTFHDVRVTAKAADVRVKVGDGVVVFKNVPLE
jgi:hypothetical protein